MSELLFKATSKEGYFFKILVDIFYGSFGKLILQINQEGIFSRVSNSQETILFDLQLHKEKFNEFYLKDPLTFGISTLHTHKIISSIKKKELIKFEIYESEPNKLYIKIIPKERNYVDCGFVILEKVQVIDMDLPSGYSHPVQVPHVKFSKMCKELNPISKEIVVSGNSARIAFHAMIDEVIGRWTEYEEGGEDSDAKTEEEFSETYRMEDLLKLSKLSSFGCILYIYLQQGLPLKIKTCIGTLGTLTVYIHNRQKILLQFQEQNN